MNVMKNRVCAATLCCLLIFCAAFGAAYAEDCFFLDVDALDMNQLNSNDYVAENLMSRAKGLCVQKYISDSSELAEPVRLTLTRMDTGTLLMDKDYGYQSKSFDSGVIYLTTAGPGVIPYLVTLYVGDTVYAMPYMQLQPRLECNSACTYGLRLQDLGLSSDWLMGTMLDLNQLRAAGYTTLDVCASNAYVIGQAVVEMQNNALRVSLDMNAGANVDILAMSLYLLTDCAAITGDPSYGGYPAAALGEWTDVTGAGSAFLYMPMQVSYDPAELNTFAYDLNALQGQLALWNQNRSGASVPAVDDGTAWQPPAEGELPAAEPFVEVWPAVQQEPSQPEPQATAMPEVAIPEAAPQQEAFPQDTVPQEPVPQEPVPQEPVPQEAAPQSEAVFADGVIVQAPAPEPTEPPQPNGNAGFEG